MNPAAEIWPKVLELLKADMTSTTINAWFDDIEPLALKEDELVLYSPVRFKRDIIVTRYLPMIEKAMQELFSTSFRVTVLSEEERASFDESDSGPSSFLPGTEEYTFDRFVVGSSNKFAYSAARAVADNPGLGYNPLFIYGPSGLGKTHLLYSVAHAIHDSHPQYRIVYIKGDTFTNELVRAIRDGSNAEFREKYRGADVFLMDDVQFIAGRDSTQEEMFHTFNTLYELHKQIVFTADRPPKEMLRLDDRLRTRFEMGLPVDIQPPDFETRLAIIKNKAVRLGMNLPEPVLQYIAENVKLNVRQIEGTVNRLLAFQQLMGESVDAASVIRAVKEMITDDSSVVPTADVIIEEVCGFYSIEPDAIRGQSRAKEITLARQIAMYLLRQMTNLSLLDIGKEFENRDHTTVLHSIRRVEQLIQTDGETEEIIKDISNNIKNRY